MSLQWISTRRFGVVTITEDQSLFRIRGHQTESGRGDIRKSRSALTVEGIVTSVESTRFEFQGTIMIRLGYGPGRKPCLRQGSFSFGYRQGNSRSWRLEDRQNPCLDHIDYVDIYLDREWRPALASPPTQAELWGIGFLSNEPDPTQPPGLSIFPDSDLPFYEEPGGRRKGSARRSPDQWNIQIQRDSSQPGTAVDPRDLREVGYESRTVIVFAIRDGYFKVFRHSLEQGAWVKREDLAAQRFQFLSWLDLLAGKSDGGLFPRSPLAVNLRDGPEADSGKKATLRGEMHDIRPTGRRQGLWLEVEVIRYRVHPCTDGQGQVAHHWSGC